MYLPDKYYQPTQYREAIRAIEKQADKDAQRSKETQQALSETVKCCAEVPAKGWWYTTSGLILMAASTYIAAQYTYGDTKHSLQVANDCSVGFACLTGLVGLVKSCINCCKPSTNVSNTDIEMGARDVQRY